MDSHLLFHPTPHARAWTRYSACATICRPTRCTHYFLCLGDELGCLVTAVAALHVTWHSSPATLPCAHPPMALFFCRTCACLRAGRGSGISRTRRSVGGWATTPPPSNGCRTMLGSGTWWTRTPIPPPPHRRAARQLGRGQPGLQHIPLRHTGLNRTPTRDSPFTHTRH